MYVDLLAYLSALTGIDFDKIDNLCLIRFACSLAACMQSDMYKPFAGLLLDFDCFSFTISMIGWEIRTYNVFIARTVELKSANNVFIDTGIGTST